MKLHPMRLNQLTGSIVALLIVVSATFSWADEPAIDWDKMKVITPRGYVCYRADAGVKIDGKLDDAAWQEVPWTEEFMDIEGPTKPKPRHRVRAKMLWDDEHFYIGAQLDEPHVWATLTKHDSVIFHDNDFEVFIDPNGDNHEYFELELNALNTTWDLFLDKPYKDGGNADNSFEFAGLKTAVHVKGTINDPSDKDEYWSVEIAIPWASMRKFAHRPAPPRDGDQWRVDFSRVQWEHEIREGTYAKVAGKREDNWIWSPPGIIDMHRPERWGFVQFSTEKPGTTKFAPPADLAVRDVLMEIYHRQKAYHAKHMRWAISGETLKVLGIEDVTGRANLNSLSFERTPEGFLATAVITGKDGREQHWNTRQDSRLWSSDTTDEQAAAIEAVLYDQADAWNRGDIDVFMEGYWKSDKLSFSSNGKVTRGWQATMDSYKKRYPTRDTMGKLKFSQLEISPIGDEGALVLGNWHLERGEPVGGNFSLVMRKIDGKWRIVHDHTSRAEKSAR
jgi:ketosteroid isomerase-like protein